MNNLKDEINKPTKLKKLNVIRKLKDYKERDKITSLLNEFNKKQEIDYFITQNNIRLGKINPINKEMNDKNHNISPYSYVGPHSLISHNFKWSSNIRQNSLLRHKYSNSLSSNKTMRQNRDSLNINKNHIIDNKSLKNYFNDMRQRISEQKSRNEDKYKLLIEVPIGIRKSLINQENKFTKITKEKKIKKLMQENIRKKCNKLNENDLLINKSQNFDKKNQELSIIDKNMTDVKRYRDNLWNITLRNMPVNDIFEKVGYLNVANKYQPMYTFFNINKQIEYFNNPRYERNKTEENKSCKLYSSLNEDNYNTQIRQNLQVLLFRPKNKNEKEINDKEIKSTLADITEEKIFARNYRKKDFFKNIFLTSKYSNN